MIIKYLDINKKKRSEKKAKISFLQEMALIGLQGRCTSLWRSYPFCRWFNFLPPSEVYHPPLLAPSPPWQSYSFARILPHAGSLSCRHHLQSHMSLTQFIKHKKSGDMYVHKKYHIIWGFWVRTCLAEVLRECTHTGATFQITVIHRA